MTSQTIFLAASSPLLTYHPYITSNTSADTSGWTAVEDGSTAQGPETTTGNAGLTYKTSGSNVSVELTYISATSITPYFTPPTSSQIQYSIDNNTPQPCPSSGSQISLSSGQSQEIGSYSFGLSCSGSCEGFAFQGLIAETLMAPSGSSPANASLDDASTLISYNGFASAGSSEKVIVPADSVSASGSGTLSYTATMGANATLYFTGTAIEILGMVGPKMSCYSIYIDGQSLATYNASLTVYAEQQTLGFWTGLGQQEHTLMVKNEIDEMGLAIDGFNSWGQGVTCFGQGCAANLPSATAAPPTLPTHTIQATVTPASQPPGYTDGTGPSAGSIVGGIIGALLALVIFFFIWRHLRKKKKPEEKPAKLDPWDEANTLSNQPNHFVSVKPKEKMGYMYPGKTAGTPY